MLAKRARAAGLESRIRLHKCEADRIELEAQVDFALAFYVVHEVPDAKAFLSEVYTILHPGGRLLLVEPKFHVSAGEWEGTRGLAESAGLEVVSSPRILLSRSLVLRRR
jgi:ubiquinone/menaquinone biosynthesis C-methylase UbiE